MARRVNENGEPIVDTAIKSHDNHISTPLENAKEAIAVLQELFRTPLMKKLHFELDVEVGELPVVRWEIERLVIKENE